MLVIFHFAILETQPILQNQVANLENRPIHPPSILQTDVGHLVERVSDQRLNQLYDSFLSIFSLCQNGKSGGGDFAKWRNGKSPTIHPSPSITNGELLKLLLSWSSLIILNFFNFSNHSSSVLHHTLQNCIHQYQSVSIMDRL